jgi:hypothetical protein
VSQLVSQFFLTLDLDNNIEDGLLCIMVFFFNKNLITIIKCLD